jgi:hypothetical protein
MSDYYKIWQGALILNQNEELLLVQKGDNGWSSAGGDLLGGEEYGEGLKGVIQKKTGIADLQILKPFHIQTFQIGQSHALTFKQPHYGIWFLCRTEAKDIKLSSDFDEFQWVSKNTYLSGLRWLHPLSKELAEKVLKL